MEAARAITVSDGRGNIGCVVITECAGCGKLLDVNDPSTVRDVSGELWHQQCAIVYTEAPDETDPLLHPSTILNRHISRVMPAGEAMRPEQV